MRNEGFIKLRQDLNYPWFIGYIQVCVDYFQPLFPHPIPPYIISIDTQIKIYADQSCMFVSEH